MRAFRLWLMTFLILIISLEVSAYPILPPGGPYPPAGQPGDTYLGSSPSWFVDINSGSNAYNICKGYPWVTYVLGYYPMYGYACAYSSGEAAIAALGLMQAWFDSATGADYVNYHLWTYGVFLPSGVGSVNGTLMQSNVTLPDNFGGSPIAGRGGAATGGSTPDKDPGPGDCSESGTIHSMDYVSDPIRTGTGNSFQRFVDLACEGTGALRFIRYYNSGSLDYSALGANWTATYFQKLMPRSSTTVLAVRPNGRVMNFNLVGGQWKNVSDVSTRLQAVGSGWTLTDPSDQVETYNSAGTLLSITSPTGLVTNVSYDLVGRVQTVTDPFGRTLNFSYYANNLLNTVTGPDSGVYTYTYSSDNQSNLIMATFPDGRSQSYLYEHSTYTNALTGIIDENGNRSNTWTYDSYGRTTSSERAGGVDHYSIVYNSDGTRTVTDPLGAIRTYAFQKVHGLVKASAITGDVCPDCGPASQTYDTNGYVTSRTDWNGNLTTYTRADTYGRPDLETSRTEAFGSGQARTITTTWHPTFRLPTLITEPNRTTAFTYDSNSNMLTRTVTDVAASRSRVWTYTYNSNGQVLTVNGPRTDVADVTTFTYYANNDVTVSKRAHVATITNALSQVTTITSYDDNGRPLTIQDPNGLVTTLSYSPRGWLSSRTVGSETTTYDYDYVGQLFKVTLPDSSYLQYTYDAAHRLTQVADNLGNKIAYTLDNIGNHIQENIKDPSNVLAQTRARVYSSLNRLYQDVGGASPSTEITQYDYDNQGNLTSITDPLNHVTTNNFDALNRLVQITYPISGLTKFTLNSLDQLTVVTDPRNNDTTYAINALDDVTQQVSPDTGTTARTYDAAGNVLTSQDAASQTTTNTYDALNRLTQATYSDGSQSLYGYDAGTNGIGRLTSITEKAPGGTTVTQTAWIYDVNGRILSDTRNINSVNYAVQYGYDSYGRLSNVTYPSGTLISYSFDGAGRISQITSTPAGSSARTIASSIAYQPFGGLKALTFGNGQSYSRTYDLNGRINGFTLGGSAQTVSFDAASRVTGQTYFPTPASSVTYGYDDLNRLTSAVTPSTTFGFTYGPNDNRTSKTVGATTWNYAYPSTSNRLSSITGSTVSTYTHDPNGSVTGDGANTFAFDTRGRMVTAVTGLGTVSYQINALAQRYTKMAGGTTTVYFYDKAGHLIAETDDGGATFTEYYWLNDTPVALVQPGSAALYYIHTDHLDTPRLIADATPATVWRWDNDDPFGGNMANNNPSGLGNYTFNLRFPGQYFDSETSFHYNYYRDYSPEIGRYVESDPIGILAGTNTFNYVDANPIRDIDPAGLMGGRSGGIAPKPKPVCPCPQVPPAPPGASCPDNIVQAKTNFDPFWLKNQVQNRGPWDYKQQGSQYQNFGNFNFGATGSAFGLPSQILYRGAGWAQQQAGTSLPQWNGPYSSYPYGDDPNDQYWIQQGIQYYQCGCYKTP